MSLNLTRGLEVKGKYSNIDYLYGPYNSPALAKVKIPESLRGIGLTVGVIVDGKVVEYWWRENTSNSGLVLKISDFTTPVISDDYVSPILDGGIEVGDTYEEAFAKIEQYLIDHPGSGGEEEEESPGSGGDTPPVVKPIKLYYGGSDTEELDVSTAYTLFRHTTSSSVSNQTLLKHYYILVRGNNGIRVVTNNNETISDEFTNTGSITIGDSSYKIFEFHIDTDLQLVLTINITVI